MEPSLDLQSMHEWHEHVENGEPGLFCLGVAEKGIRVGERPDFAAGRGEKPPGRSQDGRIIIDQTDRRAVEMICLVQAFPPSGCTNPFRSAMHLSRIKLIKLLPESRERAAAWQGCSEMMTEVEGETSRRRCAIFTPFIRDPLWAIIATSGRSVFTYLRNAAGSANSRIFQPVLDVTARALNWIAVAADSSRQTVISRDGLTLPVWRGVLFAPWDVGRMETLPCRLVRFASNGLHPTAANASSEGAPHRIQEFRVVKGLEEKGEGARPHHCPVGSRVFVPGNKDHPGLR